MKLILNEAVINRLKEAGFYPDTMMSAYAALIGLHLGHIELLDLWDDYNGSRRAVLVYYDLSDKGFWKEAPDPPLNFVETDKGKDFCEQLLGLTVPTEGLKLGGPIVEDTTVDFKGYLYTPVIDPVPENKSPEYWIDEWLDLFPKGVKSGGKLVRSDRTGCLKKMIKFIKDYKYSKDTIIGATRQYIEERRRDGWKYIRCAVYIIEKLGAGSDLAALCENYKEEESQTVYYDSGIQ